MKYKSTVTSQQFIQIGEKEKVIIEPGKGTMTEAQAIAVAKTPWGKRLIETGCLVFEKKIEVKDETVQRGMTLPKRGAKGKEATPADDDSSDEASGDDGSDTGDESDTGEEIPDFDKNAEGGNGES